MKPSRPSRMPPRSDIGAHEAPQPAQHGPGERGLPAAALHHLRSGGGILVDLVQHLFQIVESVMQQQALQFARCTLDDQAFMHQVVAEARLVALEQARQQIGIPAGMAHEAPAIIGQARHEIGVSRMRGAQDHFDLGTQFRRHAFVGVQRQHPVLGRIAQCTVLLHTETRPVMHMNLCPELPADRDRVVRTARIDHDDLVRPRHGFETCAYVRRFVLGDENDREAGHAMPSFSTRRTTWQP